MAKWLRALGSSRGQGFDSQHPGSSQTLQHQFHGIQCLFLTSTNKYVMDKHTYKQNIHIYMYYIHIYNFKHLKPFIAEHPIFTNSQIKKEI